MMLCISLMRFLGTLRSVPQTLHPTFTIPQRMAKAKLNLQYEKFLEVLKKLYINILFTDSLSQMPSYVKFLK